MGFRTGSYAKVWSVDPVSETNTKVRMSISRKNKQTGEYEQEFSGFVSFYGTAAASKAARLSEGEVIKLGDVDVTTKYDKEKNKEYVNFKCFGFETQNSNGSTTDSSEPANVDDGVIDDSQLPF